jgi:CYTH domain-containing protein
MEIERKFLVQSLPPGWKPVSGSQIRQGYFPLRSRDTEIRIRQKGTQHFITIKAGRPGVRLEEEIRITKRCFESLWPLVREACVLKTRYTIRYSGRTIELDTYKGRHQGLITAEVEFPSKREGQAFEPPKWFGREITGNRRYINESLARRGGA